MIDTFVAKVGAALAIPGLLVGSLFIDDEKEWLKEQVANLSQKVEELQNNQDQNLGADTNLFVGGTTYTLAGSGISSSATSITLTSLTLPQNGYLLQDSDFASTFYITIEPGNTSRQEFASCTTVTQNGSGTATLSGCTRGLSPVTPYTASTTLRFSHSGGSKLIFSNSPAFYDQALFKGNDESITGTYTFADSPLLTTDCNGGSANNEICAKAYIDGVAVAGASNANDTTKGIVETATQTEAGDGADFGATGARLVLGANIATSAPTGAGSKVVVSRSSDGKISPNFIATSTADTYKFGGLFTLTATGTLATTTQASSTITNLNVTSTTTTGTLAAHTSTATSSFAGNVTIGANASTSDLIVSNSCTGCPTTYTSSSTVFSLSTGTNTYTGSIPTQSNMVLVSYTIAGQSLTTAGVVMLTRSGLTSKQVYFDEGSSDTDRASYTFSWSGANFAVQENGDDNTNTSISGTAYWYK